MFLKSAAGVALNGSRFSANPELNQAEEALKSGAPKAAQRHYLNLLEQGYDNAELNYNYGTLALQAGDLGVALYHLERAKSFMPFDDNISANLNRARKARTDAEVGALREALVEKLNPSPPWNLGLSFWGRSWHLPGFWFCGPLPHHKGAFVLWDDLSSVGVWEACSRPRCWPTGLCWKSKLTLRSSPLMPRGKKAPSQASETSFITHAGAYGQIIEAQDGFLRLRLHNGLEAWFDESGLTKVPNRCQRPQNRSHPQWVHVFPASARFRYCGARMGWLRLTYEYVYRHPRHIWHRRFRDGPWFDSVRGRKQLKVPVAGRP